MDSSTEQFASDNYSGTCPEAWQHMQLANARDDLAYGNDAWTRKAADRLREVFETDCEVFFVFNGTAANSLALAALCQSYHSVICHEHAHIETSECGGPEYASNGSKLLLVKGDNGKLTPEGIAPLASRRNDIHFPKPKVVSLTQVTEAGTLYSVDELQAIRDVAAQHQLRIHMDGARFANAVAALDVAPADVTWRAGVDVLCFSGTKNGLAMGEVILFFNRPLAEDFEWRCKQAGQLASKMRYISAPWLGLLEHDTWLRNARHANACAAYLAQRLEEVDGIALRFPAQANMVIISLPPRVAEQLRAMGWRFYTTAHFGDCRFVCSWSTTRARVEQLVADIRQCLAS